MRPSLVRRRWRATLVAVSLAWAAAFAGPARAGFIVDYTPTAPSPNNPSGPPVYDPRFDRFSTNFPTEAPLANTSSSFVASGFNLSGVGWLTNNPVFGFAMISPRHFIAAAHNGETAFTSGASVSFFTGTGTTSTTVTRTVASAARVPSLPGSTNPVTDILLVTLSSDAPTGVVFYPIPVGARSQYLGGRVYVYDQEQRVGLNNINIFANNADTSPPPPANSTNLVGYDFNPSGPPGEIIFTTGDSGSPTFLNVNGQFAFLGPHLALSDPTMPPQYSLDGFAPDYVAQLNSLMLSSGFTVTTVPVPEPGSFVLSTAVFGVALGIRRLRKSRSDRR